MATKSKTVPVDSAAVIKQLKAKKVTTQMVAAFCGLADRTSINTDLRAGFVSAQVAQFFTSIGVNYAPNS